MFAGQIVAVVTVEREVTNVATELNAQNPVDGRFNEYIGLSNDDIDISTEIFISSEIIAKDFNNIIIIVNAHERCAFKFVIDAINDGPWNR